LDQKGQNGDGMLKRSHLGWRTCFFRCPHFALSLVGFGFTHSWSESQGLAIYDFSHGIIVVNVVTKIERTRYTLKGRPKLKPESM
jgi:hypothetical protein